MILPTWTGDDAPMPMWGIAKISEELKRFGSPKIYIEPIPEPVESKMVLCKYCHKRLTSECPRMSTEWGGRWASNDESKFDDWYCGDAERVKE